MTHPSTGSPVEASVMVPWSETGSSMVRTSSTTLSWLVDAVKVAAEPRSAAYHELDRWLDWYLRTGAPSTTPHSG